MNEKELQEKGLNEKESIDLIARMIRNTQSKLERGAGMPMLIWGYATIIATFSVWFAVTQTSNHSYNWLWFMIPLIGFAGVSLLKKNSGGVKTYMDKIIGYIWLVAGFTGFLISAVSIIGSFISISTVPTVSSIWTLPILFIIIVIMGMGTVLTGLVAEYKPMIIGGVTGMLIGVVHQIIADYDIRMLTFTLAFFCMCIIPGHMLNNRAKKVCLEN